MFATTGYAAIRNAKPVQLNTPVTGSLPSRSTENYYAINLSEDGNIGIDFEHENLTESYNGWRIRLFDDESKEIERFNSPWNAPLSSSANIGLPAGIYYILVEAGTYHNNADYILTVNYSSSDYWEKELNDTISAATEVEVNRPYMGSINNRRDKDYYEFNLSEDGYIGIDFEHENLTESYNGWTIKLFDDESKEIERFNSPWNAPLSSSANIGLPAGIYYILVEAGTYHNNVDYIITVNLAGPDQLSKDILVDDGEDKTAYEDDGSGEDEAEVLEAEELEDEEAQALLFEVEAFHILAIGAVAAILLLLTIVLVKARSN